ncbi:MCE family protein [Sphaerisporangium fuscum]|uniref:MCE family protein n=1 Tax=Sphaerisporangium fuscum TaxID=2835868 RepID=UPI0027E28E37|nr:MCE family protein [Sphaerisporangium fuscum]
MRISRRGRAAPYRAVTALLAAAGLLAAGCVPHLPGERAGELTISATFDDVQSLVSGHGVQISDVRVGTVTGVALDGYRAKVTMSIEDGHPIPEGTTATIAKTSILGENYVALNVPKGRGLATGPFMRSGETIADTSVRPDIEQVTAKAGPLVDALAAQDVSAILDAGATAFAGKGDDLNRLISRTTEIGASYARARGDIATAIDNLARLGADLRRGGSELDRLPGTLEAATARLVHGRHHVKQALTELTGLARAAEATFRPRHAARLRRLLDRLGAIAASTLRGKDDLTRLVATMNRFISTPPVTVDGRLLIYVWLRGLLPPKAPPRSSPGRPPARDGGLLDGVRLLPEPPR